MAEKIGSIFNTLREMEIYRDKIIFKVREDLSKPEMIAVEVLKASGDKMDRREFLVDDIESVDYKLPSDGLGGVFREVIGSLGTPAAAYIRLNIKQTARNKYGLDDKKGSHDDKTPNKFELAHRATPSKSRKRYIFETKTGIKQLNDLVNSRQRDSF